MTGIEDKRFYDADEKKYLLENNVEFLEWLSGKIDEGYYPLLSISGMQKLIDSLVTMYEFKYPSRYFELESGATEYKRYFINIKDISKNIDFNQIKFRLSTNEVEVLECDYRDTSGYCRPEDIVNRRQNEKWMFFVGFNLKRIAQENEESMFEDNTYLISATHKGVVPCYELSKLEEFIGDRETALTVLELRDELMCIDKFDTTELDKLIYTHSVDLELRERLLNLTLHALVYSNKTNPEFGQLRAHKFVEELNKYYRLDLTCDEVDKLVDNARNNSFESEASGIEEVGITGSYDNKDGLIKTFIKKIGERINNN